MDLLDFTSIIPPAISTLALGVLFCFMGYELRRIWIALAGLAFGYTLTYSLGIRFTTGANAALIALVVGLVCTALCYWIFDVGAFVLCGGCGVVFFWPFLGLLGLAWYFRLAIAVGIFVLVGLLARRFVKPVIVVATAFYGAGSLVSGLVALGIPYVTTVGTAGICCTLAFAVAGIVVQFSTARGR